MDISEAHILFDVLLDKVSSNAAPEFKTAEKDLFLNLAQDKLVTNIFQGSNQLSPLPTLSFEETTRKKSDLQNIIEVFNRKLTSLEYKRYNISSNSYQIKFDEINEETNSTYWFKIKEQIFLEDTKSLCDSTIQELPITPSNHNLYPKQVLDPFNSPNKFNPIVLHKSYVEVYLNGNFDYTRYNITYHLTFLRQPRRMNKRLNVSCELNSELHIKIVEDAVNYALETIESPRFQTQLIKEKTLE